MSEVKAEYIKKQSKFSEVFSNKKINSLLLGALAGGLATSIAFGSFMGIPNSNLAAPKVPVGIEKLPFPVSVVSSFTTQIAGITGYVVEAQGDKAVIYGTNDGKYTIVGNIVDANGQSVTEQDFLVQTGLKPSGESQDMLAQQVNLLSGVALDGLTIEGTGTESVYIAVDMECPYCHKLITEIEKLLESGKKPEKNIHIVPIAILGPDSVVTTALYQQQPKSKRLELMYSWMRGDLGKEGSKAFPMLNEAEAQRDSQGIAKVGYELNSLGLAGVPATYWVEKGQVKTHNGLLPTTKLKEIFGL